MVLPETLVEPVTRLQQNMFINAPTISQIAAMQCWEPETIEELERHVNKYRTSREVILKELASIPDLDSRNIAPADGGFYVYVDLGENNVALPTLGSVALCRALLEEEHVAFTPGIDFEDPESSLGNRRFRISYAGGIETARQAMARFHRFWPSWKDRIQNARDQK
jgi:aspartate/methionine/tyrosine aminotransferase